MKPVSDALRNVVRRSHRIAVRARVCTSYQTGINPVGREIPVHGGDVILSGTADTWGTLELTTEGHDWDPRYPRHDLQPYGNEIFVERGVVMRGTSNVEWVPLGFFRIYSVEQDEAPHGVLRIEGRDRMSGVKDARMVDPVQFQGTQSVQEVFDTLLRDVYPDVQVEFDYNAPADLLGNAQTAGGDDADHSSRWSFLNQLAKSRGKIFYFDHRGIAVVKDPPDVSAPVFEVDAGAGGVLVQATRLLDREGAYNAVVVLGDTADNADPDTPAPRAVAYNTNPNSPTYYFGPFGKVPKFFASTFIKSNSGAASAARKIMARVTGLPYQVDFSAVPNPALEPYDPVRANYGRRSAPETHVLQAVVIPLTADRALTATSREQGNVRIAVEGDIEPGVQT